MFINDFSKTLLCVEYFDQKKTNINRLFRPQDIKIIVNETMLG